MSDLQLITGLAIIISGFAQLHCGISAFHWERVVRLAWFSSITHLSCLTLLQNYFYRHKMAQLWRIPGMIALITLLIVALGPTAHYSWGRRVRPLTHDYAICLWNRHENIKPRWESYFSALKEQTTISTTFLGLGMLNRLRRLYRLPTIAFPRLRTWSIMTSARVLQKLHIRVGPDPATRDWPAGLRYMFLVSIYVPLLAFNLTLQLVFDVCTSMASEVSLFLFVWRRIS